MRKPSAITSQHLAGRCYTSGTTLVSCLSQWCLSRIGLPLLPMARTKRAPSRGAWSTSPHEGLLLSTLLIGGLHRICALDGLGILCQGCVPAVSQYCRAHRTVCPTNTPIPTVFFVGWTQGGAIQGPHSPKTTPKTNHRCTTAGVRPTRQPTFVAQAPIAPLVHFSWDFAHAPSDPPRCRRIVGSVQNKLSSKPPPFRGNRHTH